VGLDCYFILAFTEVTSTRAFLWCQGLSLFAFDLNVRRAVIRRVVIGHRFANGTTPSFSRAFSALAKRTDSLASPPISASTLNNK